MNSKTKVPSLRVLAAVLTTVLIVGLTPAAAFAAAAEATGGEAPTGTSTLAAGVANLQAQEGEWDGTTATEPNQVEGVYQIGNAAELAWLARNVNNGTLTSANAVLTADINLNNKAWTPIGMVGTPFVGTFDGQYHTVSGLSVTAATDDGYAGLFGLVGSESSTSRIAAVRVSGSVNNSQKQGSAGGIVAAMQNTTVAQCASIVAVSNCFDGMEGAGGVVGVVLADGTSSISECHYSGTISGVAYDAGSPSGVNIGGIVGKSAASSLTIDSCYCDGELGPMYNDFGGILGVGDNVAMSNCYVSASFGQGAMAGSGILQGSGSGVAFVNCYYHMPVGSQQSKPFKNNYADGANLEIDLTGITAAKLNGASGTAWKDPRKYAAGPALLAWELPPALALDDPALTVSIADIRPGGTPVISATYDGHTFTLESSDVTAAYYSDAARTQVADLSQNGTVYVKLTAVAGGDFAGNLDTLSFEVANLAPSLKAGVQPVASAAQFAGLDYTLDLSTVFEDADGDALTYKVSVDGAEAVDAAKDYAFTTPADGATTLVFTASDGIAVSPTHTVTLTQRSETTVTVDYTAQKEGQFVEALQIDAEVSNKLAEQYGYADEVEGVSALDVLVAAHIARYGNNYTTSPANYLVVENGGITKVFGEVTANCDFAVNGEAPYDASSAHVPASGNTPESYAAFGVPQVQVADGDLVEFFVYQDADALDYYAWFADALGERVTSTYIAEGTSLSLNVKGYQYGLYGRAVNSSLRSGGAIVTTGVCSGLNVGWVNGYGSTVAYNPAVTVDESGAFTVSNLATGTYYLAVQGTASTKIISSIVKVEVLGADAAAARQVADLIDALPDADKVTAADAEAVAAAKEAFDALSDEQKALVDESAKNKLAGVKDASDAAVEKAAADAAAAQAVADLIAALPDVGSVKASDAESVDAALAAYNGLTGDQKALVDASVVAKLNNVKTAADAAVKKAAADAAAAKAASDLIAALPAADKVTAADAAKVAAAKAAYDKLTADQKKLVSASAVTKLNNVKSAADAAVKKAAEEAAAAQAAAKKAQDEAAAKKVADLIAALPAADKVTAADAAKVAAAKAAYDKLTADQKKLVSASALAKLNAAKSAADAAVKKAADEAKNGLAKGKTFTVKTSQGTFTYKVTGKKKVTLAKAAKTKKNGKVTVNKVKFNKVSYKVTAVGAKAFKASKLKTVTLGNNVTSVGKQAFQNAKLMKSFTVGKNVNKLGAQAFSGAKRLTKLTVKSKKLTKAKAVKNSLKGSKVKTVKLSGVKGKVKTQTVKAFKKAGKKGVKVK